MKMLALRSFCGPFLLPPVLAVMAGEEKAPPPIHSDWYLRYEPIQDPQARSLLEQAMAFARKKLGEPAIPVRLVHLRQSKPLDGRVQIRSGFQLTEITDSEAGIFTIYLSARPGEQAFEGQLAHEAFHLQNAKLRDVYVEGLNGLLAEEFLGEIGRSFEPWLRHFQAGKDPLYGAGYFLVRDLAEAAGRDQLRTLLRFAVQAPGHPDHMEIDIDRWLASLDRTAAERARAVIERRYQEIEAIRKKEQPELAFRRPAKRSD
jgi:hypothetical protein